MGQQHQQTNQRPTVITKTIGIPEITAGKVIRKRGKVITEIKDRNIVRTNIANNDNKTTIDITGIEEDVTRASKEITKIMRKVQEETREELRDMKE